MSIFTPRGLAAACLLALAALPAAAETCLSPFVKRLDRPEKYLYVYCVDADAKDNDFLLVVDVDRQSKTYSKILHQLDLGSSGNETHHFGYTDDRTHIWGLTLFSGRVFLIDVAADPARPKLVKVIEDLGGPARLGGPHSPYALPGRMLLTFLSAHDGALDDWVRRWPSTTRGKYRARTRCATGKLPADLRQPPDHRFRYVSCFGSDEVQQWDVTDLKNPRLHSTLRPGVQPNVMHVTGD